MKLSKVAVACAAFAVTLLSSGALASSPSQCELVRDADSRHYCRATTQNKPSHCELIKNSDFRHYCRAKVKRNKLYCESIKDGDLRYRCRAET